MPMKFRNNKTKVYQTYGGGPWAETDRFHSTAEKARQHLRALYGVKGRPVLDEHGGWSGKARDGSLVHMERHHIVLSAEGVTDALNNHPCRQQATARIQTREGACALI